MASDDDEPVKKVADIFGDDDDDDDSSSDDEEPGGEAGAPSKPKGVPMKGEVAANDEGRLFWTGTWADTEEEFAAGKAKKFKYGGPVGDPSEPPSGSWNGYFFNPGEEGDAKVKEKGVQLKFGPGGAVSGGGENEFGEFSLKGAYDAATKQLVCRKAYLYANDDDDDDDIDSDAPEENYGDELAALNDEAEIPRGGAHAPLQGHGGGRGRGGRRRAREEEGARRVGG
ncbi:hypothetical protein JL721_6541 [Aureococcus anophagefferens]|nr:hypothetical protein JL721_6541 [Aureococcus anophagefferens]